VKADSAWYLISRVGVAAGQLALIPLAVYQLGVDGYGIYSLIVQAGLLLRVLMAEHVTQTVLREYDSAAEMGRGASFIKQGWKWLLLSSVAVIGIASLGFPFTALLGLSRSEWLVVIAYGSTMAAYSYVLTLLFARKQVRAAALFDFSSGLLALALPVAIGVFYPTPAAYGVAAVVAALCVTVLVFSQLRPVPEKVEKRFIELWPTLRAYGLPLTGSFVLYWIVGVADRFQIAAMLTPLDVGVYTASYQLTVAPINLVTASLISAWQPHFFSQGLAKTKSALTRVAKVFAVLGLAYIIAATACGPLIVSLFSTGKITPGYDLIAVLAMAGVSQGAANFALVLAKQQRMTMPVFHAMWFGALIVVVGNVIMIPAFGLIGAAVTTLLSYTTQTVYLLYMSRSSDDKKTERRRTETESPAQ